MIHYMNNTVGGFNVIVADSGFTSRRLNCHVFYVVPEMLQSLSIWNFMLGLKFSNFVLDLKLNLKSASLDFNYKQQSINHSKQLRAEGWHPREFMHQESRHGNKKIETLLCWMILGIKASPSDWDQCARSPLCFITFEDQWRFLPLCVW